MRNQNIPRIGFKSTTYKKTKFGKVVSRRNKSSNDENLKLIEFNSLVSGIGYLKTSVEKNNEKKEGLLFEQNDILFGKLRPYLENWHLAEQKGIAFGEFWVFETQNNYHSTYVYYLIQTPKFKFISNITTGTRMPRSDWNIVSKASFYLPTDKGEQTKIGEFFKELDELIELQQLIINNLKEMKKGFLNKIYSKPNKQNIKTNFSKFKSKWSKTTLGSLSEIVRGASPRPISDPKWFDENSDIGWLRIADVTEQNGRIMSLEQKLSKEGQKKTRVLDEPHLLLSIAASVGKPVINYIKTGVHDGFLIFKNPKFDINFMFYFFEYYEEQWKRYGQPGSQVNLNSTLVKEQKIYIPDYEEQVGIGNFFKQIDELIELEEQELESLQKMKKGFLQKMFV